MKKAFLVALTLVISVAFVTVVFAQAPTPAPEKAAPMAPEKAMKAPASTVKEESTPAGVSKKADKGKAPKAKKGGVKEESTAAGESKKADKGPAPKAPAGGSIPKEAGPQK
ncbi:MAG TPA: hypothetical protein VKF36_10130 [Syntrophorhabdales bacterium]|nr:hypothetical protein [Syntrophorhabdales bacterium]